MVSKEELLSKVTKLHDRYNNILLEYAGEDKTTLKPVYDVLASLVEVAQFWLQYLRLYKRSQLSKTAFKELKRPLNALVPSGKKGEIWIQNLHRGIYAPSFMRNHNGIDEAKMNQQEFDNLKELFSDVIRELIEE